MRNYYSNLNEKYFYSCYIYFVFILNGYIEYNFMIKIVIPHPERVYGMCNHRVAYVHQGLT